MGSSIPYRKEPGAALPGGGRASYRDGVKNTVTAWIVVVLGGLVLGAGLYRADHGGEDWMEEALAREETLGAYGELEDPAGAGYHSIASALARVPVWSRDFREARRWQREIALQRRIRAAETYEQLPHPARWERRAAPEP